jgi:hypothetical protein
MPWEFVIEEEIHSEYGSAGFASFGSGPAKWCTASPASGNADNQYTKPIIARNPGRGDTAGAATQSRVASPAIDDSTERGGGDHCESSAQPRVGRGHTISTHLPAGQI